MLDIQTIRQSNTGYREDLLVVDGQVISSDGAVIAVETLYVADAGVADRVSAHTIREWPQQIRSVSLPIYDEDDEAFSLRVSVNLSKGEDVCILRYFFNFDARYWRQPWTLLDYIEEASKRLATALGSVSMYDDDVQSFGLTLDIVKPVEDLPLATITQSTSEQLVRIHLDVTAELQARVRHGSLVSYFQFPEAVKVPCEQYLLYFTQFLQDLGINAEAELSDEAGRVLFSVTPASGEEALEKIREALDIYLDLPAAPGIDRIEMTVGSVEVQRLAANIQHLRGQLMLASAALQLKESTIQQQQLMIHHQAALLSGSVLQDGRIRTASEGDKEDILGGTVAITKLEGRGFEVNLPEIFRRLRQKFGKDE